MFGASFAGLDRRRLALVLALCFLAIAVPAAILIRHAYEQLDSAAFHQQRVLAEELTARIDARFIELIAAEEARSFADYGFLVVEGDPAQNYVQRSPLSAYPVAGTIPGLVGYFQIDPGGAFSTPLVPHGAAAAYGVSAEELTQRLALQERLRSILSVAPAPFDQLEAADVARAAPEQKAGALGRVEDLKLDATRQLRSDERDRAEENVATITNFAKQRAARKERATLPQEAAPALAGVESAPAAAPLASGPRMQTFESAVDPFVASRLDSGHFVLFRRVWRDGQRYIQGLLIEQQTLLDDVVANTFRASALAQTSDLVVAFRGDVLALHGAAQSSRDWSSAGELSGALLYRTHLSPPLNELSLIYSVRQLPPGPGANLLHWVAALLAIALCGGFYLMYRLGARQIALARQQQDFVSAVSHELKTPLTSIRMYGEMLREGWGSEAQKKSYYDYICDESGRLSRLIQNVLQLARMTRNELPLDPKPVSVAELMDAVRSKVSSQAERAGFALELSCDEDAAGTLLHVDADAVLQIVINLVDNAIKFSAKAQEKRIDIACRRLHDGKLLLSVRDYGPGVPRDQAKKIFELFYRAGSELTRETVGTGIGLALVDRLARAMGAKVDVINREPGAEFRVSFA